MSQNDSMNDKIDDHHGHAKEYSFYGNSIGKKWVGGICTYNNSTEYT